MLLLKTLIQDQLKVTLFMPTVIKCISIRLFDTFKSLANFNVQDMPKSGYVLAVDGCPQRRILGPFEESVSDSTGKRSKAMLHFSHASSR